MLYSLHNGVVRQPRKGQREKRKEKVQPASRPTDPCERESAKKEGRKGYKDVRREEEEDECEGGGGKVKKRGGEGGPQKKKKVGELEREEKRGEGGGAFKSFACWE